ncbi:MAG: hypothetical protein MGG11_15340, partial [Trichodesmium sp. MAG_R03]|nr:hypothetical protein [Trichodesmium sp. MAG_R03]
GRWEVGGVRWEVGGGRWEVGGGRWQVVRLNFYRTYIKALYIEPWWVTKCVFMSRSVRSAWRQQNTRYQ